jgi:hypothetical protein
VKGRKHGEIRTQITLGTTFRVRLSILVNIVIVRIKYFIQLDIVFREVFYMRFEEAMLVL